MIFIGQNGNKIVSKKAFGIAFNTGELFRRLVNPVTRASKLLLFTHEKVTELIL